MSKFKRFTSALLAVMMILTTCVVILPVNAEGETPYYAKWASYEYDCLNAESGTKLGVRFVAKNSFDHVVFKTQSASNAALTYTIQVYQWNTDYATTVAGTALVTKENYQANQWDNKVALGQVLPAGDYLYVLTCTGTSQWTNLYTVATAATTGSSNDETTGTNGPVQFFYNGSATTAQYQCLFGGVVYTDSTVTDFGAFPVPYYAKWASYEYDCINAVSGTKLGVRFVAKNTFDHVVFKTQSASNAALTYTIQVYQWNADYATTVAGTALVTKENYQANQWDNKVELGKKLPAGDYLYVLTCTGTSQWTNLYTVATAATTGSPGNQTAGTNGPVQFFYNGSATTAQYQCLFGGVVYTDSTVTDFGAFPVPYYAKWASYEYDCINAENGTKLGIQFTAKNTFDHVVFKTQSASNAALTYTIQVYKWDMNYETTVAGTPLFEKTNYQANQWDNKVALGKAFPAGEYLYVLTCTGTSQWTNLYTVATAATTGSPGNQTAGTNGPVRFFYNGSATTEQYKCLFGGVVYTDSTVTDFGAISEEAFPITETPVTWATYDNFYGEVAIGTRQTSAGVRFNAANEFNQVLVGFDVGTNINVAVYEWTTDYATTIAGTAKFTKSLGTVTKTTRKLTAVALDSALPAGEYLVLVTAEAGTLQVYSTAPVSTVQYFNGGVDATTYGSAEEIYRCMVGGITYVGDVEATFGEISLPHTELWGTIGGGNAASLTKDAAVRFDALNSFNQVAIALNMTCDLTVSLYSWNTDYDTTVAGSPVVTKSVTVNINRNDIALDSALPAGEYLLVVSSENADAQIWTTKYTDASTRVQYFYDGTMVTDINTISGGITYVDSTVTGFGDITIPYEIRYAACQTSTDIATAETFDIRFIAVVDSLDYMQVGFEIWETNNDKYWAQNTKSVYKSLNGTLSDGSTVDVKTAEALGGQYIVALTIKNVPADQALNFVVRPFVVHLDGSVDRGAEWNVNVTAEGEVENVKS